MTVPPCKPAATLRKVRALLNTQDGTRSALCVARACENGQLETTGCGGSLGIATWEALTMTDTHPQTLCDTLWSNLPLS